ncbi:MAG: DUF308 domain-containing protein [Bacteroides sp.]|nr:DUF308 domain-containing protein [Bacteroides sp.]
MKNEMFQSVKQSVKYWWVSLLIGILGVVIGIWCLFAPDTTLVALTYVFIFGFLISGIFEVAFALSNRNTLPGWGWTLVGGLIDLFFGILLLFLPTASAAMVLIYFVGFWIMFRSVWMIGESFELKRIGSTGWGWFLAFSIFALLFSFIFLVSPFFSGVFIISFVSAAFIVYGISRIYLAFQWRRVYKVLDDKI